MRNERKLDKLEGKLGSGDKVETWAEDPITGLEDDQAEELAKALLAKRYNQDRNSYASTEDIKADLGEDTYKEAKAELVKELTN